MMRPPGVRSVSLFAIAIAACLIAAGCGCSKSVTNLMKTGQPRDKTEPGLLLMYLDDSGSMDAYRKQYGDWAIQLLRKINTDDPDKVGVRLCIFRSGVTSKADLKLTGKGAIEK